MDEQSDYDQREAENGYRKLSGNYAGHLEESFWPSRRVNSGFSAYPQFLEPSIYFLQQLAQAAGTEQDR